MKILVLGGTRFIGLHIVRILCGEGHEVSILNRGVTPAEVPVGVKRLHADRNDSGRVKKVLEGSSYDAVLDLSGYSPDDLKPVVEVLNGKVGHYVFCSSGAVYGLPFGRLNQAGARSGYTDMAGGKAAVSEEYPVDRSADAGQYGQNKISCEDLLMDAYAKQGFPGTSLRAVWVYGPDNHNKTQEASFFARLTLGRKIIIPGDGHTLFHMIHVDDLANAFISIIGRKATYGQVYNIAESEGTTANSYVQALAAAVGVEPTIMHMDCENYEGLHDTLGFPAGYRIFPYPHRFTRVYDIGKAKQDFDWSPKYNVQTGMAMTYLWWKDQNLGFEDWDFTHEDEALAKTELWTGR